MNHYFKTSEQLIEELFKASYELGIIESKGSDVLGLWAITFDLVVELKSELLKRLEEI